MEERIHAKLYEREKEEIARRIQSIPTKGRSVRIALKNKTQSHAILRNSTQLMKTHGGKRKGAGRPTTGRRHYTVTIKPKEMDRWKEAAKAKEISVGELMERTRIT